MAQQVAALPLREVILDGELTWSGTAYHVFDVLWLDGRDLRQERDVVVASARACASSPTTPA